MSKPKGIDDYFSRLSNGKRAALQKLREDIQAAAPKAVECICYQLPAFRLDGKMLLAFGAATNHCAFYPGAFPITDNQAAVKNYDTSTGTIRFPEDKPLPTTLVKKLVKSRIAQRKVQKPKPK